MKKFLIESGKLYLAYMAAGAAAIPAGLAYAIIVIYGQATWLDAAVAILAGLLLAHCAFTHVSDRLRIKQ
jgi:hypothetical protein